MFDFDFLLSDRIQKIRQINEQYDLRNCSYVSFSGGKDSTVLSKLIDLALPANKIPRVFCNTGIEYKEIVNFVKSQQEKDDRIVIINSGVNIHEMLEQNGYPFKSKEHAHKLQLLQQGSKCQSVKSYFTESTDGVTRHNCPKMLMYQRNGFNKFKVSDKCCTILKKRPMAGWSKENGKPIAIIGIRSAEGGQRAQVKNCLYYQRSKLKKFSPMLVCDDDFVNQFIERYNVELCKLYYAPFNFQRTGCKGCPFNIHLEKELAMLGLYFPAERKQCEQIFKPVYDEYRILNYRLHAGSPILDETL